jgi:hypothetical protein
MTKTPRTADRTPRTTGVSPASSEDGAPASLGGREGEAEPSTHAAGVVARGVGSDRISGVRPPVFIDRHHARAARLVEDYITARALEDAPRVRWTAIAAEHLRQRAGDEGRVTDLLEQLRERFVTSERARRVYLARVDATLRAGRTSA